MSNQYRLVQSGKTASDSCSAGQGSSEPVAPRIVFYYYLRSSQFVREMFLAYYKIGRLTAYCQPQFSVYCIY
jgi:hypothetical protein